jgi:hypothetical protein
MMQEIKQDISIWATPSYAIRLAQLAREMIWNRVI